MTPEEFIVYMRQFATGLIKTFCVLSPVTATNSDSTLNTGTIISSLFTLGVSMVTSVSLLNPTNNGLIMQLNVSGTTPVETIMLPPITAKINYNRQGSVDSKVMIGTTELI